jgi:hypothetical protein
VSFVTLAEFKEANGITDTTSDVDLQRALDAAADWIVSYTGRTFSPVDTSASPKLFLAYDNDVLDVPDVQSVSLVEIDQHGDATFSEQLPATDYDLYPLILLPGNGGYLQIRIKPISTVWFQPGYQVRVTGTWGYGATVPAGVKEANIILANRFFHRPSAPFSLWEAPQTGQLAQLQAVDPDIASLLSNYVTVGGSGRPALETWVLV